MPSSERAAAARALTTGAQVHGIVPLCRLTDTEEILLGSPLWALADADVVTRWSDLDPDRQLATLVGARRGLVARGLLTAPTPAGPAAPADLTASGAADEGAGDHDVLVPAPALGLVIAARTRPTFVVVTTGPPDRPVPGPRLYALVDDDGLQGLVVEVVAGGQHDYRLASPELAARGLAAWGTRHLRSEPADRPSGLAVELLRHRDGEQLTLAGVVLTAPRGLLTLAVRGFDGARERVVAAGDDEVEEALRRLLLDAALPSRAT